MKLVATLHETEFLLAVCGFVTSLETFSIRDSLRDKGLLSWRLQRLSHPGLSRMMAKFGINLLFCYPGVLALIVVRLVASIAVFVSLWRGSHVLLSLLILCIATLAFTLRSPQGNDGADQMGAIVLVASALGEADGTNFGVCACLAFVAAQASLSYATAGFLKLKKREWRDGTFVTEILKTSCYGSRPLFRLTQRKQYLTAACGRIVMYGECLLCVAAFLPPQICAKVLAFGIVFHIGVALMMGLNTFVWSFLATYPAVLWFSDLIYSR